MSQSDTITRPLVGQPAFSNRLTKILILLFLYLFYIYNHVVILFGQDDPSNLRNKVLKQRHTKINNFLVVFLASLATKPSVATYAIANLSTTGHSNKESDWSHPEWTRHSLFWRGRRTPLEGILPVKPFWHNAVQTPEGTRDLRKPLQLLL